MLSGLSLLSRLWRLPTAGSRLCSGDAVSVTGVWRRRRLRLRNGRVRWLLSWLSGLLGFPTGTGHR